MQSSLTDVAAADVSFPTFIENFRQTLRHVFGSRITPDEMAINRGAPPFVLRQVQACDPLSAFIPSAYGGRGGHVHECMSVLETAGYESLALTLTLGINGALFLQPVAKYAQEEVKGPIFDRFLQDKTLGGLMITEPDYGSDALSMQTSYTEAEGGYNIQGVKHWGGLTGWADFWLLTARRRDEEGLLGRDVDFFICDVNQPGQRIVVEEYFRNLGLYMIPYGRNRIDVTVPAAQRLVPHSTGIKMMLDLLHRSRTQFPGMAIGFLRRMLDEALAHTQSRRVGGARLLSYDQVAARVARLQAYFTAASALCVYTSEHAGLENDLSKDGLPANSIKTVCTDMMQEAAQSLLQLVGAKGYRLDHIAGRSLVDSRPFQIFEGSNDMLYAQIAEASLKLMRRVTDGTLFNFLHTYSTTAQAADFFKDRMGFHLDPKMPQRKLVDLGKIISRVFTMDRLIDLGERGFRSDLVAGALQVFREDVHALLASYGTDAQPQPVVDYRDEAAWLQYVPQAQ